MTTPCSVQAIVGSTAARTDVQKMWLWNGVLQPALHAGNLVFSATGTPSVPARVNISNNIDANSESTLIEAGQSLFIWTSQTMPKVAAKSNITWTPGKGYAVFALGDPAIQLGPEALVRGLHLEVIQTTP